MPHNVLVLAARTATGTVCAYQKRERFALECVASLSPQRISLSLHTPRITKRHTTGDVLSHISSVVLPIHSATPFLFIVCPLTTFPASPHDCRNSRAQQTLIYPFILSPTSHNATSGAHASETPLRPRSDNDVHMRRLLGESTRYYI